MPAPSPYGAPAGGPPAPGGSPAYGPPGSSPYSPLPTPAGAPWGAPGASPYAPPGTATGPGGSGQVGFLQAFTKNISATILFVVSIIATILFGIIGPPTAIMALLGLKKTTEDPAKGADYTKTAWLVFALNAVIGAIALAGYYWWVHR